MSLPERYTLLVIEGREADLAAAADLLRDHYNILTGRTAAQGAEILKSTEVHIILTDQGIPQMLQKSFLKEMKGDYPKAVQIVLTGKAEIGLVIDAINQGYVFRYVRKPWNPSELRDVLAAAAAQYRRIVEREILLLELERANKELQVRNEQLKELDRLRTAFMAVASHELRTPVTLIGGFATLLLANTDHMTAQGIREMTDKIRDGAARLERIIKSMFQMLESGEMSEPMHIEMTRPKDLIQLSLEDAKPFIARRRLNVHVQAGDVPPIPVDPSKIKDVLDSVLLNAVKFTPDGGRIDIELRDVETNGRAEIVVRDHGVGIHPEDLQHIFEPMFSTFDTLHHSSGVYEFQKRGIGLGLAISRKFVELHGGTIGIESQVGKGTTVKIGLPKSRPRQAESCAAGPERTM
jgi:signal transduction histidine kinase